MTNVGTKEMVADLASGVRLPKLGVSFGEGRERLRVLSAQCTVNWLPDRHDGVEERIVLAERRFHIEGRHRLVKRPADNACLPVQDGEGLRQCLLVDFDSVERTGRVRQGGETYCPVHLRLVVPRPERVGSKRVGVVRLHESRGRVLRRP